MDQDAMYAPSVTAVLLLAAGHGCCALHLIQCCRPLHWLLGVCRGVGCGTVLCGGMGGRDVGGGVWRV